MRISEMWKNANLLEKISIVFAEKIFPIICILYLIFLYFLKLNGIMPYFMGICIIAMAAEAYLNRRKKFARNLYIVIALVFVAYLIGYILNY